jgi:serine acetyltransferase
MKRQIRLSEVVQFLIADSEMYRPKEHIWTRIFKLAIFHPGFQSVIWLRLMMYSKNQTLSKLIRLIALTQYGADFSPGCFIGKGFRIEHPVAIVIGRGVRIGEHCTISQSVTIGEKYIDARSDGLYPKLGNYISIGSHVVILGSIEIHDGVTIGASSLVLRNVPPHTVVKGIWS